MFGIKIYIRSLGMMYYEILFGYMPYYGNSPDELYN